MEWPKTLRYHGQDLSIREIARLNGCDAKVVYRYYARNGTADGIEDRHLAWPRRIPYKGKLRTIREIAKALGAKEDTVRGYYRRHRTMDGFGNNSPRKGKPVPQLERFYYTLDESIPLDRCLSATGYRSVRQFCKVNEVSESLLGCWRKGKMWNERDLKRNHPNATLLDEMTNFKNGISTALYRVMVGTGFLEYELFPTVFTENFYDGIYGRTTREGDCPTQSLPNIEERETRRIILKVLKTLPGRHREIVELAFGLSKDNYGGELTYNEIGQRYGLTRERVRQIICKGIRELRRPSRMKALLEVCWWKHDSKVTDGSIRKDWRTR